MTLSELIQSDTYINLLDNLDKYIPDKIDRQSKIHETLTTLMEKWIQHSSFSCDDLHHTILNHQQHLLFYIIKKQAAYTEPNGGRDNIRNLAPKVNFPISHIIEYCILSSEKSELLEYIKKIRIPAPQQYTREIEKIFSETKPS
ncbi:MULTISPECIES: hypothetical protein [Pseudomonas]|nr:MULTISPECIES: hypothetical protein [Pseudomonas]MDD2083061.1 hypothetical protein [Pseudomonas putida]QXZ06706.1 hypothetical protein HG554_21290 [Pseudomonas putida]UUX23083.1 hypothetical protein M8Z99_21370 [Pseudomonas putida]UUX28562.1 hypothetical protein M8003_21380 [Pseudomonas putida]UUX67166.1 hypothetical protein M8001_21380 [Pseudomonas putida]